jgi:uncharacterized Zn-binding protein involved in type VI secretion
MPSAWEVYRDTFHERVSNTPERSDAALEQAGNTVSAMGGVATNWYDSFGKALEGPQNPPGANLSTGERVAQRVRQVQQIIGGVTGLIGLGQDMLNVGFANLTAPIAAVFPSLPAATIGMSYLGPPHAHSHPPSLVPPAPPVPLPSLGPITLGTCVRVLINNMPAARCGDIGVAPTCGGIVPFFQVKTGSSNTFIGGNRAARFLDVCTACSQADDRKVEAGKFMQAVGKAAEVASTAIEVAGVVAGAASIAADVAEAAVEDDAAMASAKALSAAMTSAQMAADAAAKAMTKAMGKDPGIPPGAMGALILGHPNVLIGGFPMVNIPNPVDYLLDKLKRFAPRPPAIDDDAGSTQPNNCGK